MRYRIEFLSESTDEQSVSASASHNGPLDQVISLAAQRAENLKSDGFQIRDLDEESGRIVWLQHCRL